ncbi:MAG: hypothetical protein H0X66_07325 [Verrucomicrobia bacterium]|nr:hypothetical protein [Verrucomicrobiota bacterium]
MARGKNKAPEESEWKGWLSLLIGFLLGLAAIGAVLHNKSQKATPIEKPAAPGSDADHPARALHAGD